MLDTTAAAAVHVWLVRVPDQCVVREKEAAWLDAHERERACAFARENDRRVYTIAHVVLRRALAEMTGEAPGILQLSWHEGRKPRLAPRPGPAISFNLSHTRDHVACAISEDCEVGIDVESLDRIEDLQAYSRYALHPREGFDLEKSAVSERASLFYRYWTAKEALLKALGIGLMVAPRRLCFSMPARGWMNLEEHPLEAEADMPTSVHAALLSDREAPRWAFAVAALAKRYVIHVRRATYGEAAA